MAREPRPAAGRPHRGRQHPDRRRLAGAVRAEKPEDLAGLDVEVDRLHGLDAAGVGLAEAPDLDRGGTHFGCLLLGGRLLDVSEAARVTVTSTASRSS